MTFKRWSRNEGTSYGGTHVRVVKIKKSSFRIDFSRAATECLGNPNRVEVLVEYATKQVAIRSSNNLESAFWVNKFNLKQRSINCTELVRSLSIPVGVRIPATFTDGMLVFSYVQKEQP